MSPRARSIVWAACAALWVILLTAWALVPPGPDWPWVAAFGALAGALWATEATAPRRAARRGARQARRARWADLSAGADALAGALLTAAVIAVLAERDAKYGTGGANSGGGVPPQLVMIGGEVVYPDPPGVACGTEFGAHECAELGAHDPHRCECGTVWGVTSEMR